MTDELPQDQRQKHSLASPWHTLLVLLVVALNAYRSAVVAGHVTAGFSVNRPRMYLRTILFELLLLVIVIVGVRLRGVSLQALFGQRWRSIGEMFRDMGLGLALMFTAILVVSILSGHDRGHAPDQAIQFLLPQTGLEVLLWFGLSLTAGICEEAIYRGYFQQQFTAMTNSALAGILISAAAFGAVHAYQGWRRALVIAMTSILFGIVARWRSSVRPGMFAHSLQDAIAPTLIKLLRH